MSTIKLSYETAPVPIVVDPDDTEKRHAIQSSFLYRLIRKEQDELAQSQRNIEAMLRTWIKSEDESEGEQ